MKNLEEIQNEVGVDVMGFWWNLGVKNAGYKKLPYYERPEYVVKFMERNYEKWRKEKDEKWRKEKDENTMYM